MLYQSVFFTKNNNGDIWNVRYREAINGGEYLILPLDVDSINENDSVANPDPTPRIASVHKSRFAEVVLVGCWIEAVYYGLLLFTIT